MKKKFYISLCLTFFLTIIVLYAHIFYKQLGVFQNILFKHLILFFFLPLTLILMFRLMFKEYKNEKKIIKKLEPIILITITFITVLMLGYLRRFL